MKHNLSPTHTGPFPLLSESPSCHGDVMLPQQSWAWIPKWDAAAKRQRELIKAMEFSDRVSLIRISPKYFVNAINNWNTLESSFD